MHVRRALVVAGPICTVDGGIIVKSRRNIIRNAVVVVIAVAANAR